MKSYSERANERTKVQIENTLKHYSDGAIAACSTTTPVPHPATTNAVATSPMVFFTSEPTPPYSAISSFSSVLWFSTASRRERPVTTSSRVAQLRASICTFASCIAARSGIGVGSSLNSMRASTDEDADELESDRGPAYRAQVILSAVSDCSLTSSVCCPYTVSGNPGMPWWLR